MPLPETKVLPPDSGGVAEAGRLLADGRLVAFPTETVYGLGADSTRDLSVAAIYEAKGRPSFNPLIVHVGSLQAATDIAEFGADDLALAQAFWPGPLTLVLPLRSDAKVSKLVTAGLTTVAIRVPAHPVARAILEAAQVPVAAPSANPSGRISATRAEHVLSGLGGRIDALVDAGPCEVGLESTIVTTRPDLRLLRPGGLPTEAIEACLGRDIQAADATDGISAPGQLVSHYAPKGALRLNVTQPEAGEAFLGFGPVSADLNLSPTGDLHEAAANLFRLLHVLDAQGASRIAVAPILDTGLGRAINDRLRRAAATRP